MISSFCQDGGCVDVKKHDGLICVTDTTGQSVHYYPDEWRAFIKGVQAGEFDLDKIPQGGENSD